MGADSGVAIIGEFTLHLLDSIRRWHIVPMAGYRPLSDQCMIST